MRHSVEGHSQRKDSIGVSILTRPEGRMQWHTPNPLASPLKVSILTRPEGRMQYRQSALPHVEFPGFQSSPGQKAGCNLPRRQQSSPGQKAGCNAASRRFNPHPARRPDAISDGGSMTPWPSVSILTRPEGRMQCLYLNFLSVLREPPDTGFSICFHCPDHFFPTATIQLRTRTYKLQWLQHVVRVRPPAVP